MSFVDISPADALTKHGEGIPLIDVRTADEWASGHAVGAVHMELGTFGAEDLPEGPLMFICAMGGRSARVAEAAAALGHESYNVDGGTDAWRTAGLPIE